MHKIFIEKYAINEPILLILIFVVYYKQYMGVIFILKGKNIDYIRYILIGCLLLIVGVLISLVDFNNKKLDSNVKKIRKSFDLGKITTEGVSFATSLKADFSHITKKVEDDTIHFDSEAVKSLDVNLVNDTDKTLFYRWIIYDGIGGDSKVNKIYQCESYNETITSSKNIELSDEESEKTVALRIYSDIESCQNDSGASEQSEEYIKQEVVHCDYSSRYRVSEDGWKLLNFDYDGIKRKIGPQITTYCYDYALAYGVYIMSNGSKVSNTLVRNAFCYGSSETKTDSLKNLMDIIKEKLDAGIPVSVHTNNAKGGQHWVLVVGYKTGVPSEDMDRSDLYILDPSALYYGLMSERSSASSFRDFQYRTWDDISSARACRK